MKHDWSALIEHLREIQPFCYVHNSGNAGDTLIYKGMCKLFELHDLKYHESSPGAAAHIVSSGGGNLVPLYKRCRNLIEGEFGNLKGFTLLPHTVSGNEDLLRKLDSRFTLFCREIVSYEHCKQYTPEAVRVELAHDLAFALMPASGSADRAGGLFPGVGIDRQIKWWKKKRMVQNYLKRGGSHFFRTDKEAPDVRLPEMNLDLSEVLSAVQRQHAQRIRIADTFMNALSEVDEVSTNRLHVAIAAALLSKPTRLFAGSYHKNRSIYEHSIKGYFPNVEFSEYTG